MTDRENVLQTGLRVARGERLPNFSADTLNKPMLCAQFVRELVEGALALGANGWPLAVSARQIQERDGRDTRRALDYEQAARELGLTRDGPPQPGDVLYWPYQNFGHTAVYLGEVDGVDSILENTNDPHRGQPVFGSGPIRLTAYHRVPPARTVAAVSPAALRGPDLPASHGLTNQDVINAVYHTAQDAGQDGWEWIGRAGLAALAQDRQSPYRGAAILNLPGLTAPEKIRVAALLDPQGPGPDGYARALLAQLPPQKVRQLNRLLGRGDVQDVNDATVFTFRRFCEQAQLELSVGGIAPFSRSGGTGEAGGSIAIDPAAALAWFDALTLLKLLLITGAFEGSSGFVNLGGNFDGQGLSFGVLQWNFGQGSLPPLLLAMQERDPGTFAEVFGSDTPQLLSVLQASKAEQVAFAARLNDDRCRLREPWNSRFVRLGQHPPFQAVQLTFAARTLDAATALARTYGLHTERGLTLMFDIRTQNGSIRPATRDAILAERGKRGAALGRPPTEQEVMTIIADFRARDASPRWQADVRDRKLTIVNGHGQVHGTAFDLGTTYDLGDRLLASLA